MVLYDNTFLIVDIFFCAVITCQDLYDPTYGRVNVTGYTPGYKAHYKCDYGYKLVGEAYRECLYTGYWGGEEPVCERKSVKKLFKSRLRNRFNLVCFSYLLHRHQVPWPQ